MKNLTFLRKLKSKIAMLFALMLTSGLCFASIPDITPKQTWHLDVTTLGASVEFHASSQIAMRGYDEYRLVPTTFGERIADLKQVAQNYFGGMAEAIAYKAGAVLYADAPDLSAISTGFFKKGPETLRKKVNTWDLQKSGIRLYKKVKAPIKMPKLSAKGGPRPYRTNDDSSGNGFKFTDRTLTVRDSKWDFTYNPKEFRNTYLDDDSETPEYQQALDQIGKEYLGAINNTTMGSGNYNASGTGAVDIATGFLTIIADEITATNITPIVTGSISSSNAVTKVELLKAAMPAWMREEADANGNVKILCSYDILDKYTIHYRASFGVNFLPRQQGGYFIDGTNIQLVPVSWLGASQRLILTIDNNLCAGTDSDGITVHPSMKMDQIETRFGMPVGFEIADLDALIVNDQA